LFPKHTIAFHSFYGRIFITVTQNFLLYTLSIQFCKRRSSPSKLCGVLLVPILTESYDGYKKLKPGKSIIFTQKQRQVFLVTGFFSEDLKNCTLTNKMAAFISGFRSGVVHGNIGLNRVPKRPALIIQ
jgi:hypothetical protein